MSEETENMREMELWRLEVANKYATKEEVKVVDAKVEANTATAVKHEFILSTLADKLDSIIRLLGRIAWIISTPVIVALITGSIWVLVQAVNNGLL